MFTRQNRRQPLPNKLKEGLGAMLYKPLPLS